MANALRHTLLARASITQSDRMLTEHRWLATRQPKNVNEKVETHYHAIESLDRTLAEQTAWYYGADLRRIAFDLSKNQQQYPQAADIYRTILRDFDAEDAYAWEYLGFNLAYAYEGKEIPSSLRDEIREAYAKASRLDSDNPLYKGRELAFRAQLGERVRTDFQRYLRRFRQMGDEAVSYLAKPILVVMSYADRRELAHEKWADVLTSHPELRGFF
jgi:hypothetical protein